MGRVMEGESGGVMGSGRVGRMMVSGQCGGEVESMMGCVECDGEWSVVGSGEYDGGGE